MSTCKLMLSRENALGLPQLSDIGHRSSVFVICPIAIAYSMGQIIQNAQLSQRDRAAGCVIVFAKSRTLELGDNDLRTL